MYTETITLDAHPDIRFTVEQDLDADDPRGWDDNVQVLTYRAPWQSRTDDAERLADTRTMEVFGRVYDATGDDGKRETLRRREIRRFKYASPAKPVDKR